MTDAPRRQRDPEARRKAIVAAAADLITEVGVDAITHRKVAARAGVPLGATTQYFDTLDDLRADALALLAGEVDARVRGVQAILEERGPSATVLTGLLMQGLADAAAVHADRTVVTAAVHDPRVRELARSWAASLTGFLTPVHGALRAEAAAVFIDGILWHSVISPDPIDPLLVETGLAGILGEPAPQTPSASAPKP